MASETESINKNCIIYINRLSDLLFVLARKINIDSGEEEILWKQT
jgi:cob(I)alamin adenosyltransferase